MIDFTPYNLFMIWFGVSILIYIFLIYYTNIVKKYRAESGELKVLKMLSWFWPIWMPFFILYLIFKLIIWSLSKNNKEKEMDLAEEKRKEKEKNDLLWDWPCQQLLGGSGSSIDMNVDGKCQHLECHPNKREKREK